MELRIIVDVPEDKIDKEILQKINDLEDQISYLNQRTRKAEDLLREVVATQFPQLWIGGRNGMTKDEFIDHLAKTYTSNEKK